MLLGVELPPQGEAGRLARRTRVVVETLGLDGGNCAEKCGANYLFERSYLEEYAVVRNVPPEVRDRVSAVSAAGLDLQDAVAVKVRADLACFGSR